MGGERGLEEGRWARVGNFLVRWRGGVFYRGGKGCLGLGRGVMAKADEREEMVGCGRAGWRHKGMTGGRCAVDGCPTSIG